MNQAAIDRGLFRSSFYRTYVDQERSHVTGDAAGLYCETFERPGQDHCVAMRHGSYEKVDCDGLVSPGVRVSGADILVGKVNKVAVTEADDFKTVIVKLGVDYNSIRFVEFLTDKRITRSDSLINTAL